MQGCKPLRLIPEVPVASPPLTLVGEEWVELGQRELAESRCVRHSGKARLPEILVEGQGVQGMFSSVAEGGSGRDESWDGTRSQPGRREGKLSAGVSEQGKGREGQTGEDGRVTKDLVTHVKELEPGPARPEMGGSGGL